ncbi:MAG: hypothetical protein KC486_28530 [Myxococcales bacterium]|nr:hypothetical protein [Myxococcales bacterium]
MTAPRSLAAPPVLLEIWSTFDGYPMETLTKAWVARSRGGPRQRSVDELEAHRARTGASGNCFDLAIWLVHRLRVAGVAGRVISDDIDSRDAHVAVLAEVAGRPFLCDLGDMWLRPIAVDRDVDAPVTGFFPAAAVSLRAQGRGLAVTYHRPGGKRSAQRYDLAEIPAATLRDAAEANQRCLAQRLVETRAPAEDAHWEFEEYASRWSTPEGLRVEPPVVGDAAWAARIAARTGMRADYVEACLAAFRG